MLGPRPDHRVLLHAMPTSSPFPLGAVVSAAPTGSVLGVAGTGAAVLSRAGWVWGTLSCLIPVGPGRIAPVFVPVVPPPPRLPRSD